MFDDEIDSNMQNIYIGSKPLPYDHEYEPRIISPRFNGAASNLQSERGKYS